MKKHYHKDINEITVLKYFRERALEIANSIDTEYLFCEVGTRTGTTAMLLLDAIRESNKERWLFTIDPYGDRPYRARTDIKQGKILDYDEQCYRNGMIALSTCAYDNDLLHCHWRMTSKDFMDNIDSIEFWHKNNKVDYKFGLVFLDGEHYEEIVMEEFNWFKNRMIKGGMIIIDDVSYIWQDNHINQVDYLKHLDTIFKDGEWHLHEDKLYYIKK